jgi:hypothetical protein
MLEFLFLFLLFSCLFFLFISWLEKTNERKKKTEK